MVETTDNQVYESVPINFLRIGELILSSPCETMDDLIDKAKNLLANKQVSDYLKKLSIDHFKGGGYLG